MPKMEAPEDIADGTTRRVIRVLLRYLHKEIGAEQSILSLLCFPFPLCHRGSTIPSSSNNYVTTVSSISDPLPLPHPHVYIILSLWVCHYTVSEQKMAL